MTWQINYPVSFLVPADLQPIQPEGGLDDVKNAGKRLRLHTDSFAVRRVNYEYGELDMLAGVRLAHRVQLDQFENRAVSCDRVGRGGGGLYEWRRERIKARVDRCIRSIGPLAEQANGSG